MDEAERLRMTLAYHRKQPYELPNENVHASIHVTVETQVAMGDETPVAETIDRLIREGLDRHDAIHVVGTLVAERIWGIMKGEIGDEPDPESAYFEEVKKLTAQRWYEEYGENEV